MRSPGNYTNPWDAGDDDLRRINELVVQRGKEMLLKELEQRSADDDQDGGSPVDGGGKQLALDELIKPSDWPEEKNWGTLTIDASCTPADITYPRDLKLLNEARATTERIVDELCEETPKFRKHRPRYQRGMAGRVPLGGVKPEARLP